MTRIEMEEMGVYVQIVVVHRLFEEHKFVQLVSSNMKQAVTERAFVTRTGHVVVSDGIGADEPIVVLVILFAPPAY